MFYSLSQIGIASFTTATLTIAVFLGLPKSELRSRCLQAAKYLMAFAWLLTIISPDDFNPRGYVDDFLYLVLAVFLVESARREPIYSDH